MFRPRPLSMPSNPIGYLFQREYQDSSHLCKKILSERLRVAQSLYSRNLLAHYGCVNAIEFSNGGELLASGGDDRRILLWNVEGALNGVCQPQVMRAQHISNVFCLGYDSKNTKIFSAGNDDQVIVHDIQTGDVIDYFLHEQPVYCLSVDPCNDNVFVSACDDGRILIYDIRDSSSTEPLVLASSSAGYHGVKYNPIEPRIVATANAKDGAALWDVRNPGKEFFTYGEDESCMSVCWDKRGMYLLALRRRLPPVMYSIKSEQHLAQFDHPSYYNSCTMKSCCFAGEDDQYILSGSDDFNLYMWKVPKDPEPGCWVSSAHLILRGHRSIVNQVRFNPTNHLIASSGVEKLIKVWSPFPLNNGEVIMPALNQRKVFSHEEYINLVLTSGQLISHDYSHQSTKEDPRMMAFFDSLVQKEIEGWSSDESRSEVPSLVHTDRSISDSSLSSEPEYNENDTTGSKKSKSSNPIVKLIARKRAQLVKLAKNSNLNNKRLTKVAETNNSESTSDSDSDDSGTVNPRPKKFILLPKKRILSSDDSSSSNEEETQKQIPTHKKRKVVIDWSERYNSENEPNRPETPTIKEPSTSSETPDSGIAMLEKPSSSKSRPRCKRNYRKRLPDSD